MRRQLQVIFILVLFISSLVWGQVEHPEVTRTRGYPEYKRQKQMNDKMKDQGLELHLEKVEMEKREYQKALEEHRAQKRKEKPLEYTEFYQEKLKERAEFKAKRAQDIEEFRFEKKEEKRLLQQAHINELEELGLPEDRPRFDLDKRSLYGASPKFGKGIPSSGASSSSGGGFSFPDSNPSFSPPPASFDEFPPPPSFPDGDNFDLPPPPPPPMPFDDGGDAGMNQSFDDFPPPPPPPPVDDFNF